MKASVVVALYNTGPHLRELVASLDAQTMPRSDFEVVLVDDGSTDDTLALARELAETRPHLRVETIPNSGWPGRPRNVGIDVARGDYVFFSDHDDRFGPRALERMHASAVENGSDIVYGKIVRTGRSTPYWSVWARDVATADISVAIQSRTVHKLYRRDFLLEHGMRFREGPVRLEDHEFMALALAEAKVVSIVASEPCYWWIHRRDGSNNSDNPVDPEVYWGHYRHVLETWQRVGRPGPVLDAARLASAQQAFSRFSPKAWLNRTVESREALFAAVHPLFRDHYPPELDQLMPVFKRLRSQALRDGDLARFHELQNFRRTWSASTATASADGQDGRLRVVVSATCHRAGRRDEPLTEQHDGRVFLRLGAIAAADDDRALLDGDLGTIELTIRHRTLGIEWPIHTQTVTRETHGPGFTVTSEAYLDLTHDTFGGTLAKGTWDLLCRAQFLGESLIKRVAAPRVDPVELEQKLPASVLVTDDGLLSFKVGAEVTRRPRVARVEWQGRRLLVELAAGVSGSAILVDVRGQKKPRFATTVARGGGPTAVEIDVVPADTPGLLDLWLRDSGDAVVRLAYEGPRVDAPKIGTPRLSAYATAHNSLSVKRTPPDNPLVAARERARASLRRSDRVVDLVRRFQR